ncbi:MAG: hypothetical protein PHR77_15225 [Kiritimatiellae bacterium]|nr:hypothetical protein [Kiritimatiellia bacterium]MDD5523447.1 hypothetical protein [Kiritimatiellia bacterium]
MRVLLNAILMSCLILLPAFSADLRTYKDTYDKNLGDIVTEHGMSLATLRAKYVKALEQHLQVVQKSGDLDKTKACLGEIERFSKEKNITEDNVKNSILDIKTVQLSYISEARSMELIKARKVMILAEQYDKALGSLQADLTKQGTLDDASKVQEERKKVQESLDIKEARACIQEQNKAAQNVSDSSAKKEGASPSIPIPKKAVRCTVRWSCADDADVYINGKPLREYKPDFINRPEEAQKDFSTKTTITIGDIITVGCKRGGAYGFLMTILDNNGKVVWNTNIDQWETYTPSDKKKWQQPQLALKDEKGKPTIVQNPFFPQAKLQSTYDSTAQSIWLKEDPIVYFVSTIGRGPKE